MQRKLIKFYYESKNSGKKEWRKVEPYIVYISDNGKWNIKLSGLPIGEASQEIEKTWQGHYLIN